MTPVGIQLLPWGWAAMAAALLVGGTGLYRAGQRAGAAGCEATWQAHTLEQNAARQSLLDAASRRGAELTRQLAARETHTRTIYKEVIKNVPTATLGRACLGPDALGLLDRYQAALAPALPGSTGQPADSAGTVASDTQITGWAVDAIEQHERERARCNALIAWHADPSIPPTTETDD